MWYLTEYAIVAILKRNIDHESAFRRKIHHPWELNCHAAKADFITHLARRYSPSNLGFMAPERVFTGGVEISAVCGLTHERPRPTLSHEITADGERLD